MSSHLHILLPYTLETTKKLYWDNEILQFEKHQDRDRHFEKDTNDHEHMDFYGNLLKWSITLNISQQSRSLPHPISSNQVSVALHTSHHSLLAQDLNSSHSAILEANPCQFFRRRTLQLLDHKKALNHHLIMKIGTITQFKHYETVISLGLKSSYLSEVSHWSGIDSLFFVDLKVSAFLVEDGGGNLKSFHLLISILLQPIVIHMIFSASI